MSKISVVILARSYRKTNRLFVGTRTREEEGEEEDSKVKDRGAIAYCDHFGEEVFIRIWLGFYRFVQVAASYLKHHNL